MKEIGTYWFNSSTGTVGLVVGEDVVTKERKAYIGAASGVDEQIDTEHIKRYGSKVSLHCLQEIVALMEKPSEGPRMTLKREK